MDDTMVTFNRTYLLLLSLFSLVACRMSGGTFVTINNVQVFDDGAVCSLGD